MAKKPLTDDEIAEQLMIVTASLGAGLMVFEATDRLWQWKGPPAIVGIRSALGGLFK